MLPFRRFRLPALFCALAVLICELISRPFTSIGVCDDGPYILMVRTLSTTGHIVFNGGEAAMMGWQLYLAALFVKLFGFSFSTVRMSTLLVAVALAFVLQRTLVRANTSERNATIATLALVLSPLYLLLSATFMSDITGLFAIVLCLYGCLRALQAPTSRAAIGWFSFAVVTNAVFGTSRQIAWLGILVMVPSALWLLRAQRRIFLSGAAVNLAGVLFIFACVHWLKHQPYIVTVSFFPKRTQPLGHVFALLFESAADIPFLLLPLFAIYLPVLRDRRLRIPIIIFSIAFAILLIGFHFAKLHPSQFFEPAMGDWINIFGTLYESGLEGQPPLFLYPATQALLTIASIGGFLSLVISFIITPKKPQTDPPSVGLSWRQLRTLLLPFVAAYYIFLVPLASTLGLSDRYLLGLLVACLPMVVRYYQEKIRPQLPLSAILLVAIMAIYAIVVTHNTFALYRARTAIAAEINAAGIPDTAVNNGWEFNYDVELQHADHLNDYRLNVPANAYIPPPPLPPGTCQMILYTGTPHIRPLYSVSYDPNACYGPASFAPVHYSRWLASHPGDLYVVRAVPPSKQ